MKKVLILGGSFDQKPLVDAFNKHDFYTIIIDYNENPPAKELADKHFQFSWADIDRVIQIGQEEKIDNIATCSIDKAQYIAAYVAEQLGIHFQISSEQAKQTTDKLLMKKIMVDNDIPTAPYVIIQNEAQLNEIKEFKHPVIVKPVDSSGSKGISVVSDLNNLMSSYLKALNESDSKKVIIENFIDGIEYSVDCLVKNGSVEIIGISKNMTTLFNETNIITRNLYEPDLFTKQIKLIKPICQKIAKTFDLKNTPLFLQMKFDGTSIYVIEFTARIAGGFKSYFLQQIIGENPINLYANSLLLKHDSFTFTYSKRYTSLNFVLAKKGTINNISGFSDAHKNGLIDIYLVSKNKGCKITGSLNGGDRIGAFISSATTLKSLYEKTNAVYNSLFIGDSENNNLIIKQPFLKYE